MDVIKSRLSSVCCLAELNLELFAEEAMLTKLQIINLVASKQTLLA